MGQVGNRHECGHRVAFNTQAVAESSLARYKPVENQAHFKVVQCPACGWWLIETAAIVERVAEE